MRFSAFGLIAGLAFGALSASLVSTVIADQPAQNAADSPTKTDGGAAGFPDLVSGLREIEGVMGVEAARTASGKNVIFAWFENKAAAKRWYYSDMHRRVMEGFAGMAPEAATPMADIADDIPILCIATVTPATKEKPGQDGAPFSQISIELYTTLPGGIALGGSFSPETLKVKGLERY
jgi:hypothetical protein